MSQFILQVVVSYWEFDNDVFSDYSLFYIYYYFQI